MWTASRGNWRHANRALASSANPCFPLPDTSGSPPAREFMADLETITKRQNECPMREDKGNAMRRDLSPKMRHKDHAIAWANRGFAFSKRLAPGPTAPLTRMPMRALPHLCPEAVFKIKKGNARVYQTQWLRETQRGIWHSIANGETDSSKAAFMLFGMSHIDRRYFIRARCVRITSSHDRCAPIARGVVRAASGVHSIRCGLFYQVASLPNFLCSAPARILPRI
jgi:hypothetical protein